MTVPRPANMFSTYTIKRFGGGSYVTGVWTPGAETTFDTVASVQPATPDEILNLPESQRTRDVVKVYTNDQLNTADDENKVQADRLVYQGEDWEIQKVWDYRENTLAHFKALAIRIDRR